MSLERSELENAYDFLPEFIKKTAEIITRYRQQDGAFDEATPVSAPKATFRYPSERSGTLFDGLEIETDANEVSLWPHAFDRVYYPLVGDKIRDTASGQLWEVLRVREDHGGTIIRCACQLTYGSAP